MAPQEGPAKRETLKPSQIKEIVSAAMEHVSMFNGAPVYVGRRKADDRPFSNDPDFKNSPWRDVDGVEVDVYPAIFTPTREYPFSDATVSETGAYTDVVHASLAQFLDLTRRVAHPGLGGSKDVRDQRNKIVEHVLAMREADATADPEDQDAMDTAEADLQAMEQMVANYLTLADGTEPADPIDVAQDASMSLLELARELLTRDPSNQPGPGNEG